MLLHQGAKALELWTGRAAPTAIMRRALEENLQLAT
jgi:shikimate 5-dehydrogenase